MQRIAMGSRLSLLERVDAFAAAAWSAAVAGALDEGDQVSEAGMAVVQPGQALEWTLHLVAWRAVILLLLGKWDAALVATDHGVRLWHDAGQPAAGYAARGFAAGLIVARARRDADHISSSAAVIRAIASNFEQTPRFQVARMIERGDVRELAAALERQALGGGETELETHALALAVCNDAQVFLAEQDLLRGLERAQRDGAVILEAEIQRAIGLSTNNRAALENAMSIYEKSNAGPYAARTRCELALLDGDRTQFETGLAYLDGLGDVVQVERYLKRWSSR